MYRGWRVAAFIVLFITGVAWLFFRGEAGYIGGGAWLALLFLPAVGLRRVTQLAETQQYASARKLARLLQFLHPSVEFRQQVHILQTLETRQAAAPLPDPVANPITQDRHRRLRNAPAVIVFIALNAAAFLFEIFQRDWQSWLTLHRLGALEPDFVVRGHQYWRLVTALFLHYDVLHLLFNLFALFVLGPPLERAIGSFRFSLCYLLSGIGSSAGVVGLTVIGLVNAGQLVGASGCVMGIVGAWAAFLLRHRHAPLAKQRLMNILMIVAIQIAFDLSTPQVSMSAHLCGLMTGFLAGLALAPTKKMSI